MNPFKHGQYKRISETPLGINLWIFLNSQKAFISMETATFLGHPALEGLQNTLIREFGEYIKDDDYKRMIGKMARQVMESMGYELDSKNVQVQNKILFSTLTSYKKV